jgi:hypothetical protein
LHFEGGTEPDDAVLGLATKPLGGWTVEATWLPQWQGGGATSREGAVLEAVERTDVDGVAVFWLEQPGTYDFSSSDPDALEAYCWWTGNTVWRGDRSKVVLELMVGCT